MIKSELVQRIADRNPHLYLRDVEKIVNAILDEIVKSPGTRRPGGAARARRFFGQASPDSRLGRDPRTERAHVSVDGKAACASSRPARKCANASTTAISADRSRGWSCR